MIYWFTGTSASSTRFYHENAHMDAPTEPTTVLIGHAAAAACAVKSIRRFVDRDHEDVVSWHERTVCGYHAAHLVPDVLIAGLRAVHGSLLTAHRDA